VTLSPPTSQSGPVKLTITGWASLADYQAILQGVQYLDTKTGNQDTHDRTISVVVNDGARDSQVHTVTVDNVTSPQHGPVIGTDHFTVSENPDGTTTVSGLYVTDTDTTAPNDTFTMHAETAGAPGSELTPDQDTGSLAHINSTLSSIIYNPGAHPPATDMVTVTVADGYSHSDVVNFIFNQGGTGPSVILTGTSQKDVIFATGHNDTLTGGASADQFVFAPENSISADTITDFKVGEDHIDLRAFSQYVDSGSIATWLTTHAAASPANSADTLITLNNGNTITLSHVAVSTLHADSFIVSQQIVV
jgi:Peptidase M10 serralysin C terminal